MIPQIIESTERKLVGIRKNMSLAENKTGELWREFLPQLGTIANRTGNHLFSLQRFPQAYFVNFNPRTSFEKWAAIEVTAYDHAPRNMECLTLPAGLFAVFHYVGSSAEAPKVFQYIYAQWLPSSEFLLDEKPHFEILGEKYKNDDPCSEEDIWIPIKYK